MFFIKQAFNLNGINRLNTTCRPVLLITNPRKKYALSMKVQQRSTSGNIEGDNSAEAHLQGLLRIRFPAATAVEVQDISGGCGAMYEVWVEAPDFKGLSRVKQHRLITEALAAEIKDMHGLRISTSVPEDK